MEIPFDDSSVHGCAPIETFALPGRLRRPCLSLTRIRPHAVEPTRVQDRVDAVASPSADPISSCSFPNVGEAPTHAGGIRFVPATGPTDADSPGSLPGPATMRGCGQRILRGRARARRPGPAGAMHWERAHGAAARDRSQDVRQPLTIRVEGDRSENRTATE